MTKEDKKIGKKKKRRLRDLKAFEVSLVDKPANQREFLIIKRIGKEGDMSKEINLDVEEKEEEKIETEFDLIAKMQELLKEIETPAEGTNEEEKTEKADAAKAILGKIKAMIDAFLAGKKPGYYYAYPYPYPYPYKPAKKDDLESLSEAVEEMKKELDKRTKELEAFAKKFNEAQAKISKSLEEAKPVDLSPLNERIQRLESETTEIKKIIAEIPVRKGFGFTPPGEKREVDETVKAILDDRSLHPAEKFKQIISARFKADE